MPSSEFSFSSALLDWFDHFGRHDLPWQVSDDLYKVWVSEIMLQQTQVKTVLQYFDRFIERFPTVHDLGRAQWDDVAPYWAGLGYYARARNLHKAAALVSAKGKFPETLEQWMELPGIGRSTAGALMSLGLRQYGVIMDGNVKRVLARFLAIEHDLSKPVHEREMWKIAEQFCPEERNHDYTQAIMDLGATVCTPKKPLCLYCPMQSHCRAHLEGRELELPVKKAKKAVPVRIAHVLLVKHQQDWFWQQRPNEGLWGGLWCLPIFDDIEQMNPLIHQFNLKDQQHHFSLSHSFTHFTWNLKVKVFDIEADQQEAFLSEMPGEWISAEQAMALGIPTAMKKLIHQAAL